MYKFKSKVWLYPGMAGWNFVTVPKRHSKNIQQTYGAMKKGWGSLPVNVTVGNTKWQTSIFPDSKIGSYLLPLKVAIRKKENVKVGDLLTVILEIKI